MPIIGSASSESLSGSQGNDELHGGAGNDSLYGNEDDDLIYGDAGNDTLKGGSGDDMIDGGIGTDVLTGGDGSDSFDFSNILSSTATSRDTVTDFVKGEDVIDFSQLINEGILDFTDIIVSNDGTDTFVESASSSNDFELELTGVHNLDDSDFVWG